MTYASKLAWLDWLKNTVWIKQTPIWPLSEELPTRQENLSGSVYYIFSKNIFLRELWTFKQPSLTVDSIIYTVFFNSMSVCPFGLAYNGYSNTIKTTFYFNFDLNHSCWTAWIHINIEVKRSCQLKKLLFD